MQTKLTPIQLMYLAKYFTASNLATDPRQAGKLTTLTGWLDRYWDACVVTHQSDGVDIMPEFRSFERDLRRNPTYWVKQFQEEFGADALDKLT